MKATVPSRRSFRLIALGLCLAMTLALVAAAIPRPALAATCVAYYVVRKGDTTARIAHTFDLKWKQIAVANDLDQPYELEVGQRLCIPPEDSRTEPGVVTSKTKMAVSATSTRVAITLSGLSTKSVFYVKVRDASVDVRGWYKIGTFKIGKNAERTYSYAVPKELASATFLTVCLKNATTDELICRNVYYP